MSAIQQAMWSSFYEDHEQIQKIVAGALAMSGDIIILIETGAGADWNTHRVSLFTIQQYENYLGANS